jgi:hypothetical protein
MTFGENLGAIGTLLRKSFCETAPTNHHRQPSRNYSMQLLIAKARIQKTTRAEVSSACIHPSPQSESNLSLGADNATKRARRSRMTSANQRSSSEISLHLAFRK